MNEPAASSRHRIDLIAKAIHGWRDAGRTSPRRRRVDRVIAPLACVVAGLTLFGSAASSESTRKPAVSQINGTVSGFYAGSYQTDIFTALRSNSDWDNAGGIAADVVLPVGSLFGLSVSGGGRWGGASDASSAPPVLITQNLQSAFFVGADFFWRNPEAGFVGLFYTYDRDRSEVAVQIDRSFLSASLPPLSFQSVWTTELNQIRLAGGVYFDEVDLVFDGEYDRTCSTYSQNGRAGTEDCGNGFELGAAIAGYPGSADRVRVGFGLFGGQPLAGQSLGDVGGIASISWQPHFFGNRWVRLNGLAGGGAYVASGGAEPFALVEFSLSIDLPGADDLKQLFREMQI